MDSTLGVPLLLSTISLVPLLIWSTHLILAHHHPLLTLSTPLSSTRDPTTRHHLTIATLSLSLAGVLIATSLLSLFVVGDAVDVGVVGALVGVVGNAGLRVWGWCYPVPCAGLPVGKAVGDGSGGSRDVNGPSTGAVMRESPVGESNDTLNEVEEGRPLLAGSRGCAVDASGNVNANGVVSGEVTIGKKGKEVDVTLRMNISVTCDVSLSIGANMLAASLDRLKGTSLESHQPVISALAVIVAILMLAHVFAGALGLQRAITERVHMLGQAVWFAVVAVVTIMSCLREEELGKYGGIGLTADF